MLTLSSDSRDVNSVSVLLQFTECTDGVFGFVLDQQNEFDFRKDSDN